MNDFLAGELDLLTIIQEPEVDDLFTGKVSDNQFTAIEVSSISKQEVPPEWMPASDFFIERELLPDIRVVEESVERKRAVVHCSLNPPEAREEPKITAEHLGQAVKLMQRLVKHAYRKAMRDSDIKTSSIRDIVDTPANYELEVFAFSSGSFTIHMQSTALANMFGYSYIEKAFKIIDTVNQQIDNPEETVETVAKYGGHFATAYKDLLEFVINNKTPLTYEWAMPEMRDTKRQKIPLKEASPIYDLLMKRKNLGQEEKRLVGTVTKVDVKWGTWRLSSEEDNREYSGKCAEGVSLAGITAETQRYEFLCIEQLEEERGTGKESSVLYLKSSRALL